MFSVRAVRYNLSHTTTKSTLLFVSNDSSSHLYTISRSTSQRTDQHHTCSRNKTWSSFNRLCLFPFEGQCSECLTSSRVSWDAAGLGLPLERPFPSCEWIINSRTRFSRKFLCVILPPHDLCIRNAFRMVMSVRWKNSFLVHFHVLRAIP